jgi:hypothetical protein
MFRWLLHRCGLSVYFPTWRALQSGFAACFDDTRADEQVLLSKFGIAHALRVSGEMVCLDANLVSHLYAALENGSILKAAGPHALITRVYPDRSGTAGWFEESNQGVSVVSKNGGGDGFHSLFVFLPGKGDAAILLWTSSEAKGDSLVSQTAQLLSGVCGVPAKGAADTGDGGDAGATR